MQKLWSAATVAAAVSGVTMMVAPQALAIGNENGSTSFSGNDAVQEYGNQKTKGDMSGQLSLVQGTLNKPCIGALQKVQAQSLIALLNVGVQDIPILSAQQNQQCTEGSTQAKKDEPLSHVLNNIPVLSGNGATES
ncbi:MULTISPECIES: rodlin [unclassified Streptomyces]|uniref:Rodlin n=1 Tax=Streptomyces sp. NBC_00060 TaxID=2975636 RepID=A0AAU2HCA7_9ACTN